ncbi:MAG: DUF3536 domain-containing protein [Candidatus Wallbacteria bacterium]|nr:DUF3536 domain-containing protein [Candidatus Wallbacteria bacterium]
MPTRQPSSSRDSKSHPAAGLYLVIHGHFYQPPRENPWLGSIDRQPTAAPYHDWNERIEAQCYGPNRASRILDGSGRIEEMASNYEHLSFNFGPTLLSWLASRNPPATYRAIVEADRASARRLGGHGNALGQVYNHMIMPLADPIDRRTQVLWGKADFRHHFGRDPEGMWLAETGIDRATARELIAAGVRFTVLSPHQAWRVRHLRRGGWTDVSAGNVDTSRPYRMFPIPGDHTKYLDIFFYDGGLAKGIAFEHYLRSADLLASRIGAACPPSVSRPYLVNVATDGESYGHHEPFGDMCLAYLYNRIVPGSPLKATNYAHFLSLGAPEMEVELKEPSSWSCAHGVGRWERDCGCNAGTAGYHQKWRRPLREGLDHLREELRNAFLRESSRWFPDPWEARDRYIDVVLAGGDPAARDAFLERVDFRGTTVEDRVRSMRLLESQKYAMLMYTSCAWFFDDISGIEPVQNLRYALRAIELAQPYSRHDLRAVLTTYLRRAPANHPSVSDGAEVLERYAAPARIGPDRIAAGYALEQVFAPGESRCVYPEWRPRAIQIEDPVSSFRLQLVGEHAPWTRARPGLVVLRESATGEDHAFDVVVLEGEGAHVACLSAPSRGDDLRALLASGGAQDQAQLLAGRFGRGYFHLSEIPESSADRVRERLLSKHLEPLLERLEGELMAQEGLVLSLREEGRQAPALLEHLARAVTSERLSRISREVDVLTPSEFLDRIEETYLLAGMAGVSPDSRAVSGPLSLLFLNLAEEAAEAWHSRRLDRMADLDNDIRGLLSLAETRELGIDRTAAEEILYAAIRRAGPSLEKALTGESKAAPAPAAGSAARPRTDEARRAAEMMLSLAARVNLSMRVVRGTPTALKSEAARKEHKAAEPKAAAPGSSMNR